MQSPPKPSISVPMEQYVCMALVSETMLLVLVTLSDGTLAVNNTTTDHTGVFQHLTSVNSSNYSLKYRNEYGKHLSGLHSH